LDRHPGHPCTAGDEIMIVFSAVKMRDTGYDDPRFVA
jgi:hypothetical protein